MKAARDAEKAASDAAKEPPVSPPVVPGQVPPAPIKVPDDALAYKVKYTNFIPLLYKESRVSPLPYYVVYNVTSQITSVSLGTTLSEKNKIL